ncbi:hypothetical protein GCM10009804_63960 [Kribbella hippodromi]|uniref:Uncharacterized protein n=1 Tax=Kribbella hippodromi TaxID=434347 RepID=A0ABN2EA87_9ACTN
MEPLNLMVSLSHFANDNRKHKHGLSEPAGRRRPKRKLRVAGNVRRLWAPRVRELPTR